MANKNCMVFETLGKVSDLQIQEGAGRNEVRLSGVFGVCGVRNNNKRVYNKENYGMMVENLQRTIATEGCPGELEHPNTMNITLENVSHKIESIQMNEDGTITGTILLLNTPKGQIAKAIVEGGLPLYISSRGAGSIDESGNVTLSTIKTYDLVGTPGFSQAKLALKENQQFESLNESAEDGNIMFAIVEKDEFGFSDEEKTAKKEEEKKDDSSDLLGSSSDDDKKEDDKKEDDSKDDDSDKSDEDEKKEDESDDDNEDEDNKNSDDIKMKDLKDAIDKLVEKVTTLEAELHVAKESMTPNYNAIEKWITEEFAPEFKKETITEMADYVEGWVCEEFAPEVQNWVCEECAPEVQQWVCEEFAPGVQNWVCEEFAPEVQDWVNEEFAPVVEGWLTNEFTPNVITESVNNTVDSKVAELETRINESVNNYLVAQKDNRYEGIDKMLESLTDLDSKEEAIKKLEEQQKKDTMFEGYFAVENMPAKYRPMWESLNDARKIEIARQSKMYDFTKMGILESFWAGVKFENKPTQITESVNVVNNYHNSIAAQMKKMMHK
jgi:hypothetical protein